MLQAEKRSFLYFLATYILSSLILFFIGINFYYNLSRHNLLESKAFKLREEIFTFIETNRVGRFLKTGIKPNFQNKDIAIYKNGKFLIGTFKKDNLNFKKVYWLENGVLYYIYEKQRRDDLLYFVAKKDISKELYKIKEKVLLVTLIFILIVSVIAYILGKLFLKPLKKAFLLQEEFISDATHELNTPISNILINIELIKELYPELKNIEELTKIEASAKRVSKIFKNLSFLKLHKSYKKDIKKINTAKVLEDRVEFFNTLIKSKNLKVDMRLKRLTVDIDYEDLIKIVDNLLSNAIKYSPLNSTIYIAIEDRELCIKNIGEIKSEKMVKKKFFRENQNEGGFGIGLYIVDKIAKEYGFEFKIYQDKEFVSSSILF